MGKETEIGWCDETANAWIGCEKVSPGCKNCYAEAHVEGRMSKQRKEQLDFKVRTPTKTALSNILAWNKRPWICDACGEASEYEMHPCQTCETITDRHRRRVFVGSMMDWLDEKAPIEQFVALLETIRTCTNLDFLCLTKRPENFIDRVNEAWMEARGENIPNPKVVNKVPRGSVEKVPLQPRQCPRCLIGGHKGEQEYPDKGTFEVWIGCCHCIAVLSIKIKGACTMTDKAVAWEWLKSNWASGKVNKPHSKGFQVQVIYP